MDLSVDLLPLTVPEIRRLLYGLAAAADPLATAVLAWSHWRRRHQATARRCHYKRRLALIST
ncbi:MAG: hypothetical protein OJF49_000302 [Ktedonobacterales bacterium]|jgi:hypothetical protein|nr:MAG: hypothetical protein OJF49_000302 [Ktedonobacterales bacterium]